MNESKAATLTRLFKHSGGKKGLYITGVIATAVGIVFSALPFVAVYFAIRELLIASLEGAAPAYSFVYLMAGATAACVVIGLVLAYVGSYACHYAVYHMLHGLRLRVSEHLGKLPLEYWGKSRSGSLQKTLNESMDQLESFLSHGFPNLIGAILLVITLGALMISLNVILTITTIAAIALAMLIQYFAYGGQVMKLHWANMNRSLSDMESSFGEYVKGMQEEKIFGRSDSVAKRINAHIIQYRDFMMRWLKRNQYLASAFKAVSGSLLAFILPVGTILLLASPGDHELIIALLMFLIVSPAFYTPLFELLEIGADFGNVSVRLDEIETLLDTPALKEPRHPESMKGFDIVFENVSYSYSDQSDPFRSYALREVNFCAPQGKVTALVGPSGGGKSTIGQLIPRFADVEKGRITIGGADIRKVPQDDLMDAVSFVFQETWIFSESVADNISMSRPVSREAIIEAAKQARCHEFVMQLPEGYDTILGEGHHRLSGGEAQRIAIARALVKDAPIVILDEATAFADAENEAEIRASLDVLLAGKTVVIIAHRLASIRQADQILALDQGAIVERGSHNQLIDSGGLYAHLWSTQTKTQEWQLGAQANAELSQAVESPNASPAASRTSKESGR